MFCKYLKFFILTLALNNLIDSCIGYQYPINSPEWIAYKAKYNKVYTTAQESNALYNFNYNMAYINSHNAYYAKGKYTYTLAANQFSDMSITQFNALFPKTTQLSYSNAVTPPTVGTAPASYNPADLGFTFTVQDQGTVCSSGWAYATAKAIEIFQAPLLPEPIVLSAQNLIDCAGISTACTTQVPQQAFDYLAVFNQRLYYLSSYPNVNTRSTSGMCIPTGTEYTTLNSYSTIADGADTLLQQFVAAGYPVVIEYNPTSFEFMHYSSGVFQQPTSNTGSHFMTVIGYGTDATTNLNYWLVQNSFGTTWGENGLIRILRSSTKTITKSAIFPSE